MTDWALSLRRSEVKTLAKLHEAGEVVVGEPGARSELVWARGSAGNKDGDGGKAGDKYTDGLAAVLALVPTSNFFEIVQEDRLRPVGKLLPVAKLPSVRWMPLREWLRVRAPVASLPGKLSAAVAPELTRDAPRSLDVGCEHMLVCRVEAFREFLLWAPGRRLSPLRFVRNEFSGEVLVRGYPLPSVPGQRFVLVDGVATPAGYGWTPAVSAGIIRAWLGTSDGVFVLWRDDAQLSEIAEDDFVAASRRVGREL